MIIGVLAAVLIPQVNNMVTNAKISSAVADFRSLENAGNRIFQNLGVYPPEGNWCNGGGGGSGNGDGRAFVNIAAVPATYQSKWNGPYVKTWPKAHPWNGCVTYLQQRCGSCFDTNGIPDDESYIHYYNTASFTQAIKQKIDKILDDGDTNTGVVKEVRGGLAYLIGEGPVW